MGAQQLSLLGDHTPPYVHNQIRAEVEDISRVLDDLHHAQDTIAAAIDQVYQMSWDQIDEEAQQRMVDSHRSIRDTLDRLDGLICRIGGAR